MESGLDFCVPKREGTDFNSNISEIQDPALG